MKSFLAALLLTACSPIQTVSSKNSSFKNQLRQRQRKQSQRIDHDNHRRTSPGKKRSFSCLLLEVGFMANATNTTEKIKEKTEWRCILPKGKAVWNIDGLSDEFYKSNRKRIKSAETLMRVTYPDFMGDITAQGKQKKYLLKIPDVATIDLEPAPPEVRRALVERQLVQKSVLVVRVTDETGAAPGKTAAELSDDIFGTAADTNNLRSQYNSCSGGKLNFVPAHGDAIVDGVADITIPFDVSGQDFFTVETWVSAETRIQLGQDLTTWSHVMFVLPRTVNPQYIGYAYYNWYLSLFYDTYISDLLVQVHEIGHNLDQQHSAEGANEYGDGTCMMGAHVFEDDAPKMCFNGAKSWWFGWYSDRHVTVNPEVKSWKGRLVGIDDYLNDQLNDKSQRVVARIVSSSRSDVYLMYNRKEGVNSQVYELGDMVTIVEQDGPNSRSNLLGGVSEETEPFRIPNWNGEFDLVIQVCQRVFGVPDYARVQVFLDDHISNLSCSTPDPPPTPSPTRIPTAAPEGEAPPKKLSDPVTVVLPVRSSRDDYIETSTGAMRSIDAEHDLFCTDDGRLQGYRFRPKTKNQIPAGSFIESAVMYVYAQEDASLLDNMIIGNAVGHAVGNAVHAQEQDFYISSAKRTRTTVRIDPNLRKWKPDRYQKLVDVAPILEEIVGQKDYREGNAIEIFLIGTSSAICRKIMTTDGGKKPKLKITYSLPSPELVEREIELQIAGEKDDFREQASGKVGTGTSAMQLWTSSYNRQAYRFIDIPIPQGAEILEARLEMMAKGFANVAKNISGIVQAEAVGNSPPFTFGFKQLEKAPKTSAVVEISDLPPWTGNEYNSLGDISPVIQEIVDRVDYTAGNAIKLILTNNNSQEYRVVRTFESGGPGRLIVRYKS